MREAYGFLANNYHPGDAILLFGFSRGAYTARAVCGLVCRLGVLTKRGMDDFYDVYRDYRAGRLRDAAHVAALHARAGGACVTPDVAVAAIGCFDTVGALGIPTLPIPYVGRALSGVANAGRHAFHDTGLSARVQHAFHALALDEARAPFAPALWRRDAANTATVLRQCWFPGVHTNVGGGYPDQEIADMTLAWMVARTRHLLDWDTAYVRSAGAAGAGEWAAGRIYNSRRGIMRLAGTQPRTPGAYAAAGEDTGECVHVSVRVRRQLLPGWAGGALRGWAWSERERAWTCAGRALSEDWLSPLEMELAGRDIVENLLGWAFPDTSRSATPPGAGEFGGRESIGYYDSEKAASEAVEADK